MPASDRQHAVHASSMHRPHDNRIFLKECRTLADSGYDVTFVVPAEANRSTDGIRILAIPRYSRGGQKLTRSVLDVLRAIRSLDREAIVHFHDPELLPAVIWIRLKGYRVIYDAHEDTPRQVFHLHWIPSFLRPAVAAYAYVMEKTVGWLADGIVVANEVIQSRYPSHKTALVRNYPTAYEIADRPLADYQERPAEMAYIGGITESRGIRQMLDVLVLVNRDYPCRLLLAGAFYPAELGESLQRHPGWQHVDFRGWVGREEKRSILARCRIGLLTLLPEKQYTLTRATKLFEYAAAGLPIIASDFPLNKTFIQENQCGLLVDPTRPDEIAAAVLRLLGDPQKAESMGEQGRRAIVSRYNWDSEASGLLRLYEKVRNRNRGNRQSRSSSGSLP